MNNEIRTAMQLFENKLASFWQIDGEMQWCEDDRIYKMESRQRTLEKEVDRARENLIMEIMKIEQAVAHPESINKRRDHAASWDINPDRMGGQFTQDEIDESSRGGHGW